MPDNAFAIGKYRIEKEIGRGASSVVYLAYDAFHRRNVAVKQIHATPAVINELIPKITRRDGVPPSSWRDLRQKVMTFPVEQMGSGLQRLWRAPSKRGLTNRLEDTMRNAEFVGRAWTASSRPPFVVGWS